MQTNGLFRMFSFTCVSPQCQWWCLVTQVVCGLKTPSLSSGVSTRCGSGCSKSWTCTRSMPPTFPSKTLTWTAISSAAWATRISFVLPAAWDPFSSTASQSSSGAVRLKVWGGAEKRVKERMVISPNKWGAVWFELGLQQFWWSGAEKGSQSRSGVALHGALKGWRTA